jgi:hypothetical protein
MIALEVHAKVFKMRVGVKRLIYLHGRKLLLYTVMSINSKKILFNAP